MLNSFFSPLSIFSTSLRLNILRFAFSAASSLTLAATAPQMARGGTTGAFRGAQRHQPSQPPAICADSAALAERIACHFSGCIAQFALWSFAAFLCVCSKNNLAYILYCSLHRLRGRVGVGVLNILFSSSGVMAFHGHSVVNPVLAWI